MKKAILLTAGMLCLLAFTSAQTTSVDDGVKGTGMNQHNYVGAGWVHNWTSPSFHNNTLSYSDVPGSYVTLSFIGYRIRWYTEMKTTHGIVAVSIDGGAETMVDLYRLYTGQYLMVYESPMLSLGTHTIKLRVTGTKNPASTGYYAIHDRFIIYTGTDPKTDTTSTYAGNGSAAYRIFAFPPLHNTGYGYKTLENSKSLINNTPVGGQNTAVGSNALVNTGIGTGNTAVGCYALNEAPADLNTAVGYKALSSTAGGKYASPPPGSSNTAIGAYSGQQGGSHYNTTTIGFSAVATASYQVRIGNSDVTSIGGKVSWSTLSDGRFKTDLQEDVSGLEFVTKLRPVSYMVDKSSLQKFLGVSDSLIQLSVASKEKPTRQTGFVAQEVDALVKKSGYVFSGVDVPKNDKDPYTIRYAEFVVPLVKAVQELSEMNEQQQKQIDQLLQQLGKPDEKDSGLQSSEVALLQNNPNPFSVNTEIKMVLPETAGSAFIIVYNLEGKQLKDLQVKGRGKVSTTILGNELSAGMYIYALIVDGKVVDTKRMILTK